MELQALNRVHRIGQSKPVFVKRFIVQDTVEENMMAIQDKKQVRCLSDVFVLHILVSDGSIAQRAAYIPGLPCCLVQCLVSGALGISKDEQKLGKIDDLKMLFASKPSKKRN